MNDQSWKQKRDCDLVVVGAGMAGLSCAWRAAKGGLRVVLLEVRDAPGGVVRSHREGANGEYLLESGPNSFTLRPPDAGQLAVELGLNDGRLRAAPMRDHDRYLWSGKRLEKVPTGPLGLLTTPLLSPFGKLRVGLEPFAAIAQAPLSVDERATEEDDVALGAYMRAHFGDGLVDGFLVPFVSGVYAADPDRVSLRAAFPRIYRRLEGRKSAFAGMFLGGKGGGKPAAKPNVGWETLTAALGHPGKRGLLISFDEGVQVFAKALADGIRELGGQVEFETGVQSIERGEADWIVRTDGDGADPWRAANVAVATSAPAARKLLDGVAPKVGEALGRVEYNNLTVVHLGITLTDFARRPDGFGFLVPRGRGVRMLGSIFSSSIFPNRAPEGSALLTCFLGGQLDPEIADLDDDAILEILRADLGAALGWSGDTPDLYSVTRWRPCLPLYRLGHPGVQADLEAALPEGMHLLGNYLRGISLPDVVGNGCRLGQAIAEGVSTDTQSPEAIEEVAAHA